jgi:hypothetical protein
MATGKRPKREKDGYMIGLRLLGSTAIALVLSGAAVSGASAIGQTAPSASTAGLGQQLSFCLDSGTTGTSLVTMNYPGNNTDLVVYVAMTGVTALDKNSVGFTVFDTASGTKPVETATIARDQVRATPGAIQFPYSSAKPGLVTLTPFNYSANQVCFSVTPVQLPVGVSSLMLSGPGAAPASAGPTASSSAPAVPISTTSGAGQSVGLGQQLTFCVPPNSNSGPAISLGYPGNGTSLVLDATVPGVDAASRTAVGFTVFDVVKGSAPAGTATLARNGVRSNPKMLELVYSSSKPGPLRIQPFNYSASEACFSVTPVQLPRGVGTINLG